MTTLKKANRIAIFIHVLAWTYIFLYPYLYKRPDEILTFNAYLHHTAFPLMVCCIFYINYFLLIPRYVAPRRIQWFIFYNVALAIVLAFGLEVFFDWHQPGLPFHPFQSAFGPSGPPGFAPFAPLRHSIFSPVRLMMTLRNFLTLLFSASVATAVHLSMDWHKAETARAVAEAERRDIELRNLKNQISPHFLLNTLNNIYALTAFDTAQAQTAILQLSRMLRHLLYKDQSHAVSLKDETDFLQSYISLMRLRLRPAVEIHTDFRLPPNPEATVAPLIFISLVENAFKHGISSSHKSFVHISLQAEGKGNILFVCENSNHPKSSRDKAGSGIGLHQVQRRLELSYPGRYLWEKGVSADGSVYRSSILLRGYPDPIPVS